MKRLTAEQKKQLAEIVERRLTQAVSTVPADRPVVEAAVRKAYESAGLPAPRIVWVESPQAAEDALRGLASATVVDSVIELVWTSVRDSVWDSVWDSVRDSVWDSVRDLVWASVGWASVVLASVWASVRNSVRTSVGASVWASVLESILDSARFEFFSLNGVEIPRRWETLDTINTAVFAWWPLDGVCILLDRPFVLEYDSTGKVTRLKWRGQWGEK